MPNPLPVHSTVTPALKSASTTEPVVSTCTFAVDDTEAPSTNHSLRANADEAAIAQNANTATRASPIVWIFLITMVFPFPRPRLVAAPRESWTLVERTPVVMSESATLDPYTHNITDPDLWDRAASVAATLAPGQANEVECFPLGEARTALDRMRVIRRSCSRSIPKAGRRRPTDMQADGLHTTCGAPGELCLTAPSLT